MKDEDGGPMSYIFATAEARAKDERHAELYRLVELYVTTPNGDPIVAEHFDNLCDWYANHKRPDGSEPLPVAKSGFPPDL